MRVSKGLLTRLSLAAIPVALALATPTLADETFSPTTAISMPNNGKVISFDISYVDPVVGLYILGDRTNAAVDVIDTTTNTVLTQLKGGFAGASPAGNGSSGPNGVLIVKHREAWAGDAPCPAAQPNGCSPVSATSAVKVIDLFNQQVTHVIDTGGSFRADEMCWDPRDQLVMVANNADTPPFASIISTKTYTVLKKIKFDGTNGAPNSNNGIEQCVWDHRTGKFYVTVPGITPASGPTVPNQGGVAVIDPVAMKVVNTFTIPVANCDTPQGMAVGPDRQLLVGCNGSTSTHASSVVIDDRNGNIIATVPNESGPDEVWFNPGDNHYFLARSSAAGTNQLLGVIDADNPGPVDVRADADAITANKSIAGRNAHSVAADPIMNQVYVPIPGGVSTICGSLGGSDANGCIAVFTTPHDDRVAENDHDHDHDRH